MLYYFAQAASPWLHEHRFDWAFMVLYQVEFRALAAAGVAFAIVLLLGRRTIDFLTRMKIGDTGLTDAEALRGRAQSKANTRVMRALRRPCPSSGPCARRSRPARCSSRSPI